MQQGRGLGQRRRRVRRDSRVPYFGQVVAGMDPSGVIAGATVPPSQTSMAIYCYTLHPLPHISRTHPAYNIRIYPVLIGIYRGIFSPEKTPPVGILEFFVYSVHDPVDAGSRVHSSIRVTPAMEAGLADHVWSIDELLSAA
jgi:hypothetical protein